MNLAAPVRQSQESEQIPMASLPKLSLIVAAVLLVGAAAMQSYSLILSVPPRPTPRLAAELPDQIAGWNGSDFPLADTEEGRATVESVLRFDQHVSRAFSRNGKKLTIYAAYWGANKIPPRAVGVHTPDTCWVQNGWKCISRRRSQVIDPTFAPGVKPAEFGAYSLNGTVQYVYFWHTVGGTSYAYEQEGLHSLTAPLQDMKWFGLNQRREQLFIRVASDVPFEQLDCDPGVNDLFRAIGALQSRS